MCRGVACYALYAQAINQRFLNGRTKKRYFIETVQNLLPKDAFLTECENCIPLGMLLSVEKSVFQILHSAGMHLNSRLFAASSILI